MRKSSSPLFLLLVGSGPKRSMSMEKLGNSTLVSCSRHLISVRK